MNLNIKKMYLIQLSNFLGELKLTGGLSRNRVKFNKIISEAIKELSEDELEIVERYCEKDRKGDIVKDNEGNVRIKPSKKEDFAKEINELYNEELIIDCNVNKVIIDAIAKIMLDDDLEVDGNFSYIHNEICEQLENYLEENEG